MKTIYQLESTRKGETTTWGLFSNKEAVEEAAEEFNNTPEMVEFFREAEPTELIVFENL